MNSHKNKERSAGSASFSVSWDSLLAVGTRKACCLWLHGGPHTRTERAVAETRVSRDCGPQTLFAGRLIPAHPILSCLATALLPAEDPVLAPSLPGRVGPCHPLWPRYLLNVCLPESQSSLSWLGLISFVSLHLPKQFITLTSNYIERSFPTGQWENVHVKTIKPRIIH